MEAVRKFVLPAFAIKLGPKVINICEKRRGK